MVGVDDRVAEKGFITGTKCHAGSRRCLRLRIGPGSASSPVIPVAESKPDRRQKSLLGIQIDARRRDLPVLNHFHSDIQRLHVLVIC
jgi:hypothetical protein